MKAIEFTFKKGNPKIVETAKPTPEKDQVLVRVVAAAIDTALDPVIQKTLVGSFIHSTKAPLYLGWHFSGVVESLGENVSGLGPGQAVWGHLQYEPNQKQGSFAEYIVVKEEECAVKPANVSHKLAAATATESLTALQAMRDEAGLEKGKSVLIVGAGGGVGTAAVQIAKLLGAHVTAVCSTKDVVKVKELGADKVVDRSKADALKLGKTFDVIFDTPCVYSSISCLKMLNKDGTYVTTLPSFSMVAGMVLTLFTSKNVKFIEVVSKQKDLELLGKWMEEGNLTTPIDSTFKVRDMEEAIERQSSKEKKGRVVIDVQDGF